MMLMYDSIESNKNYLEICGSLWKYCKRELYDASIIHFESLRLKMKITGKILPALGNTMDV